MTRAMMDDDAQAPHTDERLMAALERLAGIQVSISELNQEAARIRRYIQDFDVNLDALNVLALVRSKDERFGPGKVLGDVIRYARQTGMPVGAEDGEVLLRGADSPARFDTSAPEYERPVESSDEEAPAGLVRVLAQVAAAVAVTIALFVLIH